MSEDSSVVGEGGTRRLDVTSIVRLGIEAKGTRCLVVEWAAIHRDELARDWKRAAQREPLDSIEPLR
jgi:hypothetical protein